MTTQFEVSVNRGDLVCHQGGYALSWQAVATVTCSESACRLAVELLADVTVNQVRVSRVQVERPKEAT